MRINFLLILVFLAASCSFNNEKPIVQDTTVKAPEVTKVTKDRIKLKSDALIVDVRTEEEYSEDHLSKAINIPHDKIRENLALFGANKDRQIVVYCKSGRRAGIAKNVLNISGYTNVYNAGTLEDIKNIVR